MEIFVYHTYTSNNSWTLNCPLIYSSARRRQCWQVIIALENTGLWFSMMRRCSLVLRIVWKQYQVRISKHWFNDIVNKRTTFDILIFFKFFAKYISQNCYLFYCIMIIMLTCFLKLINTLYPSFLLYFFECVSCTFSQTQTLRL